MNGGRVAVLRFRRIDTEAAANWLTSQAISEEAFSQALRSLVRGGWEVLGVDGFLHGIEEPAALPERGMLITIDGPYRSLLRYALPVLRSYRFPAVLFVPTDLVGRRAALEPGGDEDDLCTWNDLRYLADNDISIESQGVTHRPFIGLDADERKHEAAASKAALEAGLSRPVRLFAFPRGDPGPEAAASAAIVQDAGYSAAFILGGGVIPMPCPDRYRLARITVGPDTDLDRELDPCAA